MRFITLTTAFAKQNVQPVAQACFLMAGGDLIAQTVVENTSLTNIDWKRTAHFGFLGLVLVGPTLTIWYKTLDRVVDPKQIAWKRALKKVALDQLIFAPIFTAVFTSSLSLMQGLNRDEIIERLQTDYINLLKTGLKIWPAAQIINFAVVPLKFQVAFTQVVAIFWNTYLSLTLGKKRQLESTPIS